jgi:hypothetical protein
MVKKLFFAWVISILAPLSIFAKSATLAEAIEKKWVSATATKQNRDEYSGKSLRLKLQNLTTSTLQITISAGFIFAPTDPSVQDFINLDNEAVELAAKQQKSISLLANCINAGKGSPSENTVFQAKHMATGNLLTLVNWAVEKKLQHINAMQSALWTVTDNSELTGIDHLEMAKMVATMLKKPLPDYFTSYRTSDRGGIIAAQALEPLSIKGQFIYVLPTDMPVKLDLINADNQSVIADMGLEQKMNQKQGRHRFTFEFELKGIPRGEYFVTMTGQSDGKEWGKMKVVF